MDENNLEDQLLADADAIQPLIRDGLTPASDEAIDDRTLGWIVIETIAQYQLLLADREQADGDTP